MAASQITTVRFDGGFRGGLGLGRRVGAARRPVAIGLLGLGLAVAVPMPAAASDVRTTSRTVGEAYMVQVPGPEPTLLRRRRLVQYVNLGVFGILPPKRADELQRDPKDGQLQVVSSLRVRHDFGNFVQGEPTDGGRLLQTLDGRQIDLLFGYLEGRNLGGWVDFRAGRQFEMSGLDFYVFDGGWLRLRTPAHLAVEAFAGFQVDGSAVFGFPTFELDGTQNTPEDEALSPMIGAAFGLADVQWMDARFAYRRTFSPGALNDDITAADGSRGLLSGVDQEFISVQLALRLWKGRINPHTALRYNLGTNRLDDVAAGISWALTPMHYIRGQYLRTIPSFDLDSIFNVFALTPFEDLRLVYEVRPGKRWAIHTRVQGRVFRERTTGVLQTEPDDEVQFSAGGGAGASYRRRKFSMRLDAFGLGPLGGTRAGGSVDTRTHVWYDRIALDGRTYFSYFDDDFGGAQSGYSWALQAGPNFRLTHGIYLNLQFEELVTTFTDHAFRALAILSVDWNFRVGQRR